MKITQESARAGKDEKTGSILDCAPFRLKGVIRRASAVEAKAFAEGIGDETAGAGAKAFAGEAGSGKSAMRPAITYDGLSNR